MIKHKIIKQENLTGERALFMSDNMTIVNSVFQDGESPLKESSNITIDQSVFKWKYPLWYCKNIEMTGGVLFETARAGIWYTENITMQDCMIDAPKTFRRSKNIRLEDVQMPRAQETFWQCEDVELTNVMAKGDYFAMNTSGFKADGLTLYGNYPFDGCKDIEIRNSKLLSKDAFWNCENVTVYDSFISGEYIGWNSKNLTFVNCTIESLQGFCYIDNLVMKNCKLINTNLAFEYSTVDVDITTEIESIKNPYGGKINAKKIGEIIFDDPLIDQENTDIVLLNQYCD